MPENDHAVEPASDDALPEARPPLGRGPGRSRLYVAIGDSPARWYRSPGEAVEDARRLVPDTSPGDVVGLAWDDETTDAPPAWELRRDTKRVLAWRRPGGARGR